MSYRKENLIDLFLPICPVFSTFPKLELSIFRHVTPQNVTGDFSEQPTLHATAFKHNYN